MVAVPIGFNFRATLGFVTDIAPDQFHDVGLYAASPGYGWEVGSVANADRDRNAANNARLAGLFFVDSGLTLDFRVDLPSAGDYAITLAIGDDAYSSDHCKCEIFDTSSSLFSVTSGATLTAGHYIDANGTEHTSAANWVANQTSRTATFATTILRCRIGQASSSKTPIAHLSIAAAGGAVFIPRRHEIDPAKFPEYW
jgi:hypothetical protein